MRASETVLISLHPTHADKILSGTKWLEFRRVWTEKPVKNIIIYSTLPVQKIVAVAKVKQVHFGSPNKLWNIARVIGGGLSRRALYKYFDGKKNGFAIEFEYIHKFIEPVKPSAVFKNFHPPQSFSYVESNILKKLEKLSVEQKTRYGKVIFVSGVHGVGKTQLCTTSNLDENLVHKTASELIKEMKVDAIRADSKAVKDIKGNQELLVEAVNMIRESGQSLLLDGHFAVWDDKKHPTAIETKVFSDLKIDSIISVHDEPNSIVSRINSRDNTDVQLDEITQLQDLEVRRAEEVSDEIRAPLYVLKAFDQNQFDAAVTAAIKS